MARDWSAIFDVNLMGGHIVQPEERQKQVENLINTVQTTAAYSSGLDWECLVSDVFASYQIFSYVAARPLI